MINIVNAILFRKGEILLAKRSSTRKAYTDKWSFPGGHVKADKTLAEALCRELQEEFEGVTLAIPLFYKTQIRRHTPATFATLRLCVGS